MKTIEDLKKELNEDSLFVDFDDVDYDKKEYPIYYFSQDDEGNNIKEFSGYVQTYEGEVKEQE